MALETEVIFLDNELYHYGIKGMKWGVRRYQNLDGTYTEEGKRRLAKNSQKQATKKEKQDRKNASKNRRNLSDEELSRRVKRLEQEKKLKALTDEDVAPGRTAVKNFIKTTGGRVLTSAAVGALVYAGHYAITGKFDRNVAASYIFPNPHKKK